MQHIKLAALALLAALSTQLRATTYYASPDGSGNGDTRATAGKLTTVLGQLQAGDELILLDGQYDLASTLTISRTGQDGKTVLIRADNTGMAILDFRSQPQKRNNNGVNLSGSYVHLKGLVIRYAGFKGIQVTGGNNTLEQLDVYGNCDSGVQMKNDQKDGNLVLNCDSHDNFDYCNGKTPDQISGTTITDADFGGNADGFADKQHSGGPNTYIGCRSWNNSDDGWDSFGRISKAGAKSPLGEDNSTLYIGCICYNNCPKTYDLTSYARLQTDHLWFDHFKDGATITVNGSASTLDKYVHQGNGNGFKVGGNNTVHNVRLIRCLAVGNLNKGFDQNNNGGNIEVYNCTGFKDGRNYGLGTSNNGTYTLHLLNNVSLQGTNGDSKSGKGKVVEDANNTWNSGLACSAADFLSTTINESELLGPRNADGSLPTLPLMQLKPESGLVGKGADLSAVKPSLVAANRSLDLGWYETGEGGGQGAESVDVDYLSGVVSDKQEGSGDGSALGVVAEQTNSVARYFDLNGRELSSAPARGAYIEVLNGAGRLRVRK